MSEQTFAGAPQRERAPLETYTVVWDGIEDSRKIVHAPTLDDVARTQLAELERAAEAHKRMLEGGVFGKMILEP